MLEEAEQQAEDVPVDEERPVEEDEVKPESESEDGDAIPDFTFEEP